MPAGACQPGIYGTQGVAGTTNFPGGRQDAVSWIGSNGNLWLFGGQSCGSTGSVGLNDLWDFNVSGKTWTWVSGSSEANQCGNYGAEGVASPSNVPGNRMSATGSAGGSGNFWLFGGFEYCGGTYGYVNELWKFSPADNEWTWISGSMLWQATSNTFVAGCSPGVYGTQGVPAAGNVPGGREGAVSWIDSNGNFWLFGGYGCNYASGVTANLNDLWEYNPTTKTWTWISGANSGFAVGVYGIQGAASTANVPGARQGAVSWTDSSGNLWLFGGSGQDSTGAQGVLNDLWEFNPTAKTWTWVSGSNTGNAVSVYGTEGIASAANVPGARYEAVSWIDADGNLWLFGGGYPPRVTNYSNDLWKFSPSTKTWTWVSGANTPNAVGTYGTQGAPGATDVPGARASAVSWADASGNLWLFGGYGFDSTGEQGYLNDLWRYQP